MLTTRAPAKVNLTLHVLGRRTLDGYHELESLVAFTGAGDLLSLEPGAGLSLEIFGPTAVEAGTGGENLVLRAARNFAALFPGAKLGAFGLRKTLPVAAGIGGGSSDAAAALRLLARANGVDAADSRLYEAARRTGADVPVCLAPRLRFMRGAGEEVGPALALPALPAVLVNPRVATPTPEIFSRLGLRPGETREGAAHPRIEAGLSREALLGALAKGRNDLEDAACVATSVIVDALSVLRTAKGCKLVRMSGSGATCFGLFLSREKASRAAAAIRAAHPEWWVKAAMLR
ncbi:MAG TPA: 4-(cytidine 5'-diphospho)-2-C-methyl-D-erythritol kinase [Methylocystis sp.]|nr:4-(cytidine 5'-diphospho)-2-C-methyl-D-erythritol kinase [Methylocystis sp.]